MAAQEVADYLNISRQRVHQLTERDDFPEPAATLAVGRIWRGSDIRAWSKRYRPDLAEEPEGDR
jgi:prophage regulatory protein